jgi:hypothetical protein
MGNLESQGKISSFRGSKCEGYCFLGGYAV